MTESTKVLSSAITVIRRAECSTLSGSEILNYEVGKNANDDLFVRIASYSGGGVVSQDWFVVVSLARLFVMAGGSPVFSFEQFNDRSQPLGSRTNTNLSGFLKAISRDAINPER